MLIFVAIINLYDFYLIMEILLIIGAIVLIILLFVGFGIFGWILEGIGAIIEFLFEGLGNGFGCLLKIILFPIIAFFVIGAILAMFGIVIIWHSFPVVSLPCGVMGIFLLGSVEPTKTEKMVAK